MESSAEPLHLFKRYTYYCDANGRCHSAWNSWVRWVVLAVIIVLFFVFFVLLSCLSARRRRRRGHQPFYGTGWAAYNYNPPTYQQSQQQPYYTPHNQSYYNPAPAYPQATGNSNAGYYNRDVELQQPSQSYQPADYAPPPGPPPSKG